jgi:hypothetical protein
MKIMNPKLIKLFVFTLVTFLGATTAIACVCPTVGQPIEEDRKYYQESFKGAVFTGKIRSIAAAPTNSVGGLAVPLKELVIDVDLYWLGVKAPVITAYSIGEGTSCTMSLEKDRNYFFIASRHDDRLHIGMCDLSNWMGRYPDKDWADYTEKILGTAKLFPKPQKR